MDKKSMNKQANLAMEFIDNLNFEISYLIKEIEGLLKREEEEFEIGKPRGYGISAGSSTGLEYPDWWWYKKFSVFFVPKDKTEIKGGKTKTIFKKDLKIIYLLFVLSDREISSPKTALGILYDIESKTKDYFTKFEDTMVHYINGIWDKIKNLSDFSDFEYDHKNIEFKGRFIVKDLFDINNAEDVQKKLLEPGLKQFRNI